LKISFNSNKEDTKRKDNGFGYAGYNIKKSLTNLGHEVSFQDPSADIQIDFSHPLYYSDATGQYKIGYSPWESSSLPEGWLEGFDSVNEVWTPSLQCKKWFENAGVTKPIHVYPHGVEKEWTPRKRIVSRTVRFLHVGEPAPRKGGQMALEAFRTAFGSKDDVHLTIKSNGHSGVRAYTSNFHRGGPRSILGPVEDVYQNVTLLDRKLSTEELIGLYHSNHVLVYPSWGEGFGLIPLQALATGMPTICTSAWAPYDDFLGELSLNSKEYPSPWPEMHPGMMFKPDFDHLVELYRYTYDNIDELADSFHESAPVVHSQYNWDNLTRDAFKHLGDMFK